MMPGTRRTSSGSRGGKRKPARYRTESETDNSVVGVESELPQTSSGAVQFAAGSADQLQASQAAMTNTTSGVTASQFPQLFPGCSARQSAVSYQERKKGTWRKKERKGISSVTMIVFQISS